MSKKVKRNIEHMWLYKFSCLCVTDIRGNIPLKWLDSECLSGC